MSDMTRDDVIRDTAKHIRRVGSLIVNTTHALLQRAVHHDASKWSPAEWPAFEAATPKLAGLTYGSDEYKAALASIKPAIKAHYAANPHHPEYHKEGIAGMSLLDLIEMLADWKAAGERHADGSLSASIDINAERFGIQPQLVQILRNTALEMGWIDHA